MDIRSRVSYLPKKKSWDLCFKYNFDIAHLQVKIIAIYKSNYLTTFRQKSKIFIKPRSFF